MDLSTHVSYQLLADTQPQSGTIAYIFCHEAVEDVLNLVFGDAVSSIFYRYGEVITQVVVVYQYRALGGMLYGIVDNLLEHDTDIVHVDVEY